MVAVAKLLCDLGKGVGAEVRWRWMRAVRLMGVVEGRGRWEKRAADLNGSESKQKLAIRRRQMFLYSLLGENLGSERAYLNGDNLKSDMTRDSEQTAFLPAETAPCRYFKGAIKVACTAYLVNQPAAFDGTWPWVYTESRWS
jgi:hypothetical protein